MHESGKKRSWLLIRYWLIRACALISAVLAGATTSYGRIGEQKNLSEVVPTTIDAKCRERFLAEAALAWKATEEKLRGFEVTISDYTANDEQGKLDESRREWKYCVLQNPEFKYEADEVRRQVAAANEQYSFDLGQQADEKFYLREAERWDRSKPQPEPGLLYACTATFKGMRSLWWMTIDQILAEPDFKMTGAQFAQSEDGEQVARIVFRYDGKPGRNLMWYPGAIYWADLLPGRSWAVLRSGVMNYQDGDFKMRVRATNSYQSWFGDCPFLRHHVLEYENVDRNHIFEIRENALNTPRPCDRPVDEFYLPFYGIPEASVPALATPAIFTLRRVAIIVTGLICLFLAYLVYRKSRAIESANGGSS